MKKEADVKFILGMVLLTLVLAGVSVGFWIMVGRQAQIEEAAEREMENTPRKVIVLEMGDLLKDRIFLDMDSEEIFEAEVPAEGIYNANGVLIKGDTLLYGDILLLYGDNKLVGEGIPSYPGLVKMKRVSRADLLEADHYQKIAEERDNYGSWQQELPKTE